MTLAYNIRIVAAIHPPYHGTQQYEERYSGGKHSIVCHITCPLARRSSWHPNTHTVDDERIIGDLVDALKAVEGISRAENVPYVQKRSVIKEDPRLDQKPVGVPLDRVYGDYLDPNGLTIHIAMPGQTIPTETSAAIAAIFAEVNLSEDQ